MKINAIQIVTNMFMVFIGLKTIKIHLWTIDHCFSEMKNLGFLSELERKLVCVCRNDVKSGIFSDGKGNLWQAILSLGVYSSFLLLITHQRDNESILCGWRNGMQGEEIRVVTGGGTDGFLWTHRNLSLKVQIVVPLIYQISVAKYCILIPWLVFKSLGLLPFHKLHSQVKISSAWNRDFKWHGGFVTSWVLHVWGKF